MAETREAQKPFEPSSWRLIKMIESAEAKCDASREQAARREEARINDREARGWDRAVRARHYFSLQHGGR